MAGPNHVAVIGCGFTGTSALFQLVDHCPVREITVLESSGRFGPGYPYRTDECPDYLINNTTDTMCLTPASRRAFLDWLRGRPDLAPDLDPVGHLPRAVYGRFLEEVVRAARTIAAIKAIPVRLVPAEATALRERSDGTVEIDWPGGSIVADTAILATGRAPPLDRWPRPPAGAAARFVPDHVSTDALDGLPLDAEVHVLGTSLSAYDIVNRLYGPSTGCHFEREADGRLVFRPGPNRRRIVIASRGGRLKKVSSQAAPTIRRRHFTLEGLRAAARFGPLTLEGAARLIGREAEAHGVTLDWPAIAEPYRGCDGTAAVTARAAEGLAADIDAARRGGSANFLVDLLGDAQMDIWDAFVERLLAPGEERAYRDRWETAVQTYAAPCPVSTAERLQALIRAGRLDILAGVEAVELAADGSHYRIAHRFGTARAAILVDASGSLDRRVTSPRQPPLIRSMVACGLMQPHRVDGEEAEGAAVDMQSFRLEGCRNVHAVGMLLWGPGFFTSSAFVMASLVERLLTRLYAA